MRTVFADANYWIGLFNPSDDLHDAAVRASLTLGRARIVTSEMVLAEVLNGLGKFYALRASTAAAIDAIMSDPNTEVEPQSSILFREALGLYRQHQDKEWGLTDCASFAIMRRRGLREALTLRSSLRASAIRCTDADVVQKSIAPDSPCPSHSRQFHSHSPAAHLEHLDPRPEALELLQRPRARTELRSFAGTRARRCSRQTPAHPARRRHELWRLRRAAHPPAVPRDGGQLAWEGVPDAAQLRTVLWSQLNDRQKISRSLLTECDWCCRW
jgi:predicted nucleic acid-binding protein